MSKIEGNVRLVNGDCISALRGGLVVPESIDMVFADPPFNIGYQYDLYEDNRPADEYINWTKTWIYHCWQALRPGGAFWIAIGDEQAAEVCCAAKSNMLTLRNWVIWHYTFGVACQTKFSRSHTHLLYFLKGDKKLMTFNADDVRVKSARETVYGDKRAAAGGKLPDDVWTFSRVCGTFRERVDHPCQMPEAVLERVTLATTNHGQSILDPFAGSGTTLAVARRLGRNSIGFEISDKYCDVAAKRLGMDEYERYTDGFQTTVVGRGGMP